MGCRRGSAGGIVAHVPVPKEQKEYVLRANFFALLHGTLQSSRRARHRRIFRRAFRVLPDAPFIIRKPRKGGSYPMAAPYIVSVPA